MKHQGHYAFDTHYPEYKQAEFLIGLRSMYKGFSRGTI